MIRTSLGLQKVVMRVWRPLYSSGTQSEGTMVAGNYMNTMQHGAGAPRAGGLGNFFLLWQRVTVLQDQPIVWLTTVAWCNNWIEVKKMFREYNLFINWQDIVFYCFTIISKPRNILITDQTTKPFCLSFILQNLFWRQQCIIFFKNSAQNKQRFVWHTDKMGRSCIHIERTQVGRPNAEKSFLYKGRKKEKLWCCWRKAKQQGNLIGWEERALLPFLDTNSSACGKWSWQVNNLISIRR